MVTKAKDQTNPTQSEASASSVDSANVEAATATTGQTQVYFVPEYNMSVEAESLEAAVEKAKELKGVK